MDSYWIKPLAILTCVLVGSIVGLVGAWLKVRWNLHFNTPKPFRTCEFCRYQEQSACRRYPPARVYVPSPDKDHPPIHDITVWPVVRMDNWCGEFRDDAERGKGP
jgi:hypothetical protein